MCHEERSMWKYLNNLRERILVAVIILAVLLAEATCSEPPQTPATPQEAIFTPVPPQTESSAGNAAALQSTRRGIKRTRTLGTPTIVETEDPGPSSSQASELLNGATWVLVSLDGRPLIEDTYLFLRVEGNILEGFDGCNSLWGRHEDGTPFAKADGRFSGRQIGWTDIGCRDHIVNQSESYKKAIIDGDSFRATRDRLEILDGLGNVRLVFNRLENLPGHPTGLSGTQWRLLYAGEAAVEGDEFTLVFLDDGLGAGTTACRDLVTAYKTRKERIDFYATGMIGSNAGCPAGSRGPEGRFTNDLSHANEFSVEEGQGKSLLHFRTSRGRSLTFEQLPQDLDSIQGVEWRLTAFVESLRNGAMSLAGGTEDAALGTEVTLTFNGTGLWGSTGCNSYASSTRQGSDRQRGPIVREDGSVARDRMGTVTERGCPETSGVMEQERRFLELLPVIQGVQVFGDHLAIHTEPGVFLLFEARHLHRSEGTDRIAGE